MWGMSPLQTCRAPGDGALQAESAPVFRWQVRDLGTALLIPATLGALAGGLYAIDVILHSGTMLMLLLSLVVPLLAMLCMAAAVALGAERDLLVCEQCRAAAPGAPKG